MAKLSSDQFEPNEAWLVFLVDSAIQNQHVDIYFLMDIYSTYLFGQIFVPQELPDSPDVAELMQNAFNTKFCWPKKLYFPSDNPAEELFRKISEKNRIQFNIIALEHYEGIVAPIKKSFLLM